MLVALYVMIVIVAFVRFKFLLERVQDDDNTFRILLNPWLSKEGNMFLQPHVTIFYSAYKLCHIIVFFLKLLDLFVLHFKAIM